ncbi:MAG TPA: SpoIVB peptidase S55 domain-containing protein [bacterium]|nr:SpoIVB peptidase S55 domain-containing protein [bacterium]
MGNASRAARWGVGGLAAALLLLAPPLAAAPRFIPVSQLAMGMTGVGKTVVIGTTISEFRVKILGVLRNAGPAGDLVLFRASGPVIDAAGGLASGMSGSPIYIGGRLAGAFSYAFQFADPRIGLFTPIADMLRAIPGGAKISRSGEFAVPPFPLGGRTIRRIVLGSSARPQTVAAGTAIAVPAATPLFVSGLRPDAAAEMGQALRPMGLLPITGGGMTDLPATIPLEPGSAIGVAVMRGDLAAYAIGTLTYRDGNRFVAFGHPFSELGHTDFLLTNATILQTVRAQDHNLKVGVAGVPVGTISEDRPAAVGGTIGVLPRMFGVRVAVHDTDTRATQRFGFQVVANKDLAPILVDLGTRSAVERALNRSGGGTAQVHMILRGRMLPRPVERANNFYSGSDVAVRALSEMPQALHLLFENDFADLGPSDIDIDVRVTGARQTGTITAAEMPKGPIAPGTPLHVLVTVRPFREAAVTREIELLVPQDFPEGSAVLTVRGGGLAVPLPAAAAGPAGAGLDLRPMKNLTDEIAGFESGERNTDVVVDLVSGALRVPAPGAGTKPPRAETRWTTSWVLNGRFQTSIVIGGGAH